MTDAQHEQDEREATRALFGERPEPIELPDTGTRPEPREGNHVPAEGTNGEQRRPADYDERNFVGELFGTNPNNRNLHGNEDTAA